MDRLPLTLLFLLASHVLLGTMLCFSKVMSLSYCGVCAFFEGFSTSAAATISTDGDLSATATESLSADDGFDLVK